MNFFTTDYFNINLFKLKKNERPPTPLRFRPWAEQHLPNGWQRINTRNIPHQRISAIVTTTAAGQLFQQIQDSICGDEPK
jgi:hypothetical protein